MKTKGNNVIRPIDINQLFSNLFKIHFMKKVIIVFTTLLIFSCSSDDIEIQDLINQELITGEELSLDSEDIFTLDNVEYSMKLWVSGGDDFLFVGVCIARKDEVPIELSNLSVKEVLVYKGANNNKPTVLHPLISMVECDENGFCIAIRNEVISIGNEVSIIVSLSNGTSEYFVDAGVFIPVNIIPTSWGLFCESTSRF